MGNFWPHTGAIWSRAKKDALRVLRQYLPWEVAAIVIGALLHAVNYSNGRLIFAWQWDEAGIRALAIVGAISLLVGLYQLVFSPSRIDEDKSEMYEKVKRERDNLKTSLPNIEVYRTEINLRPIFMGQIEGPVATPFFASAHFRNKPKGQVGTTAKKVSAEISFFDAHNNQVFWPPIYGRWGDTIQPGQWPNPKIVRDLQMVDIEANELPRELNIVLKHKADDCCYAFNNQSYQVIDFRVPSFTLAGTMFYIKVKLSGENTRTEWWFLLKNHGKNRDLSLDPIEPPHGSKSTADQSPMVL